MLVTDNVLFLHVPMAGEGPVTRYLVNELQGPLALHTPERGFEIARGIVEYDDVDERLTLVPGKRHETLAEAVDVLAAEGRRLDDFALVLAVARQPYELERSYFLHLQKPAVQARAQPANRAVALAASGDFERFCEEAPWVGARDLSEYFLLDGEQPSNMHVVRFERLAADLPPLVAPFAFRRRQMPHVDRPPEAPQPDLTPRAMQLIESKHPYLAQLYGVGSAATP